MNEQLAREGAESWEAIADGWAERVRTGTDFARQYILDPAHLAMLGDVAGKRVLDAGCGEGRFARMLAERGAAVTGIDFSQRMIDLAQEAEERVPRGIVYHQADMAGLKMLEDDGFDVAVAYLSIIDVPLYQEALKEVSRVLKAGGRFVFSLVHPCFCTPGSEWEPRVPGTVPIRDADRLYKKVDNYRPARETRFKMWPTAPVETINYHRPLSDYAHACREAGLLIRDIVEPAADEATMEKVDFFRGDWRAPNFIILECLKTRGL
jgi:SAM-dependent methyltransferase